MNIPIFITAQHYKLTNWIPSYKQLCMISGALENVLGGWTTPDPLTCNKPLIQLQQDHTEKLFCWINSFHAAFTAPSVRQTDPWSPDYNKNDHISINIRCRRCNRAKSIRGWQIWLGSQCKDVALGRGICPAGTCMHMQHAYTTYKCVFLDLMCFCCDLGLVRKSSGHASPRKCAFYGRQESFIGSSKNWCNVALSPLMWAQLTWTPVINSAFFGAMALLEGKGKTDAINNIQEKLWPTLRVNWVVWPVLQGVYVSKTGKTINH